MHDAKSEGCRNYVDGGQAVIKDGPWKTFYPNGSVETEGQYKNDRQVGVWISRYPNDLLKEKAAYRDGRKDGPFTSFYRNGRKEAEGVYHLDKQVGKWTEWYQGGGEKAEMLFDNSGRKEGVSKEWFENNRLKSEEEWQGGRRQGTGHYYTKDGELSEEVQYAADQRNGVYRRWFAKEQPEEEAVYRNDKRDGKRVVWYRDNVKKFEGSYVEGRLHGEARYFDLAGEQRYILQFENGVMIRVLEGEVNYQLDKAQGALIEVSP